MLIRDLPEDERPRERLAESGASALSNAELLAVFFGTGRQGISAIELGRDVINRFGSLRDLSRATFEELKQVDGIGPAKAAQLAALIEFGKRISKERLSEISITSPEDAYDLVGSEMQALSQESVRAVLLNHRKQLIKVTEVFRGTGNESFANPAEILRHAISHATHSLILVHNHPSGDPSPSRADRHATERMKSACDAIGIEFTDHLIIGSPSEHRSEAFFSFREAGLL